MKEIKELSLRELDELFRAATNAAKEEAIAHGLPTIGFDKEGRLLKHDGDRTTVIAEKRGVASSIAPSVFPKTAAS